MSTLGVVVIDHRGDDTILHNDEVRKPAHNLTGPTDDACSVDGDDAGWGRGFREGVPFTIKGTTGSGKSTALPTMLLAWGSASHDDVE